MCPKTVRKAHKGIFFAEALLCFFDLLFGGWSVGWLVFLQANKMNKSTGLAGRDLGSSSRICGLVESSDLRWEVGLDDFQGSFHFSGSMRL